MPGKTEINSQPLATSSPAPRWIERHPFLVLGFFTLLLGIQITPQFKMSPDGVTYMSIARNFLHGRIERLGSPHIRYAPGYPLLISPAFLFGERPFVAVQILQLFYAVLLGLGAYAWFGRYVGKSAIWIAALTMASAGYWDLFRTASSEIVFAPAVIWAGYFMARCLESPSVLSLIGAILFAAIACATRQAGAMLAGGFALAVIIRAGRGKITWKRALILGVIFVVALAMVSRAILPFGSGYISVFLMPGRTVAGQLAEGTRRQIAEISRLLIPGMWKTHSREHQYLDINNVIYFLVFIPFAIGWWRLCRDTDDPLALSLPCFLALYIAYPYDSGTRFTVPIFPVLAASVWYLLKNIPRQRPMIFLIFIAIHTLVSIGFWIDDAGHVRRRYERWPEIQQVAASIPPGTDVIAMRGEIDGRWMFLMCLMDRPIAPETDAQPVEPFVDWIVDQRDQPVASGFVRMKIVGNYQIEKRTNLK